MQLDFCRAHGDLVCRMNSAERALVRSLTRDSFEKAQKTNSRTYDHATSHFFQRPEHTFGMIIAQSCVQLPTTPRFGENFSTFFYSHSPEKSLQKKWKWHGTFFRFHVLAFAHLHIEFATLENIEKNWNFLMDILLSLGENILVAYFKWFSKLAPVPLK